MEILTKKQVEEIRRLNGLGFNDTNIVDLLGISWRKVWKCRKELGLPQNSRYTEMSTEKKKKSIRKRLRKDTGKRMNYRTMAHELYAMQLGWNDYQLGEALILYVLERDGLGLKTQDVLNRINWKKLERGWKPETTRRMFSDYVSSLVRKGLVNRVYIGGKGRMARYSLTERAYEEARRLRSGKDLVE